MIKIRLVKYGLKYNGVMYGWINKQLYKLPYFDEKTKRSYDLRLIKTIGNHYLIGRNKVHLDTIKAKTIEMNHNLELTISSDCPF